jgi:hypothetical protein
MLLLNVADSNPVSIDQGDICRKNKREMPQTGSYEILLSITEGNFAVDMS